MTKLHIAVCAPVNLPDFRSLVEEGDTLPDGYLFPFTGELVLEYIKQGCRVTVCTLSKSVSKPCYWYGKDLDVVVIPLRARARDLALTFHYREVRNLTTALIDAGPDVVHAFWNYEYAHAALKSKLPHFVTAEDAPIVIYKHFRDAYRFLRLCHAFWVFPRIRFNVAISPYLLKKNRLFTGTKTVPVIPNAVSNQWGEKVVNPESEIGNPRIFIIGTWDVRKNVKTGILGFQQLRELVPQARLYVIGDSCAPGGLVNSWCESNGVCDGVEFMGVQTSSQIRALFSIGCPVLLHPSLEESFGMTLIEAMACGVPVVAGENSGAVPWVLVNGTCGMLCDVRDPTSIADALHSLLNNPEKYNDLREAGLKRVDEAFRLPSVTEKYIEFATKVNSQWT